MKQKKPGKLLSLLLALVMVVGMLPSTAVFAAGKGAGTQTDPLIVSTYDDFHNAMENESITHIKVANDLSKIYDTSTNPYDILISVKGEKTVDLNGKTVSLTIGKGTYVNTMMAFIAVGDGSNLTLTGSGTLSYVNKCEGTDNKHRREQTPVIKVENGSLTIVGTAITNNWSGAGILVDDNATVDLSGSSVYTFDGWSIYSGPGRGKSSTLKLKNATLEARDNGIITLNGLQSFGALGLQNENITLNVPKATFKGIIGVTSDAQKNAIHNGKTEILYLENKVSDANEYWTEHSGYYKWRVDPDQTNGKTILQVLSTIPISGAVAYEGTPESAMIGKAIKAELSGEIAYEPVSNIQYIWYMRPDDSSEWQPISDATSATYTPDLSLENLQIKVVVTATNYSGKLESSPIKVIVDPTMLTDVNVNGIDAPVTGKMPDTTATVPSDAKYEVTDIWYFNDSTDVTSEAFTANTVYEIRAYVKPLDGYRLAPQEELTTSINGNKAEIGRYDGENVGVMISYTFPATEDATIINSVSATITTPQAGQTPSMTAVAGANNYTAEVSSWYLGDNVFTVEESNKLALDAKFEAGKSYVVMVDFFPVSEAEFAPMGSLKATINGEKGKLGGSTGENGRQFAVVLTVPAESHTHSATLVTGQAATCTADGWKDYYKCDCGKFFEDAACTTEISDLDAWKNGEGKLAKLEHTFGEWQHDDANHWKKCSVCSTIAEQAAHTFGEWTIVTPATETADGLRKHTCSVCGHEATQVIPATGHTHVGTLVAGQAPTHNADGWKDYYKCSCGKFFEDAACTNEIPNLAAWQNGAGKLDKLVYIVIEGNNSSWQKNTDGTITFRVNGDFADFTGIKVDGTVVASKHYTAKSGSTIVTLNKAYLQSLSEGSHTITFLYTDGQCEAKFNVTAAATPSEPTAPETTDSTNPTNPTKPNPPTGVETPQTGDASNIMLWLIMSIASALGLVAALLYRRKKNAVR